MQIKRKTLSIIALVSTVILSLFITNNFVIPESLGEKLSLSQNTDQIEGYYAHIFVYQGGPEFCDAYISVEDAPESVYELWDKIKVSFLWFGNYSVLTQYGTDLSLQFVFKPNMATKQSYPGVINIKLNEHGAYVTIDGKTYVVREGTKVLEEFVGWLYNSKDYIIQRNSVHLLYHN